MVKLKWPLIVCGQCSHYVPGIVPAEWNDNAIRDVMRYHASNCRYATWILDLIVCRAAFRGGKS